MSDKNSESFEEFLVRSSLWEIFIDDVEGELAMVKIDHGDGTPVGGRTIKVVALEEIAPLIESKQKKIDELEKRWNVLSGITNEIASDRKEFLEKLQAAEEENKILREAVEFYADEGNWITQPKDQWMQMYHGDGEKLWGVKHSLYIGGRRARQALERVKKE